MNAKCQIKETGIWWNMEIRLEVGISPSLGVKSSARLSMIPPPCFFLRFLIFPCLKFLKFFRNWVKGFSVECVTSVHNAKNPVRESGICGLGLYK